MSYELEYSKEFLGRLKQVLVGLGWLIIVVGVTLLGRFISPQGVDGKPILLSPRLARIAEYQRDVKQWARELKEIHAGLAAILSDKSQDLFDQDGRSNQLYGELISLQEEVDGTETPPTLEQLNTMIGGAVSAHLAAASGTVAWLNEPTETNRVKAEEALGMASRALDRVIQSPWVLETP